MTKLIESNLLHKACLEGDLKTVKLLIAQDGLDINTKDHNNLTALHIACFRGFKDIAEELIAQNADINGAPSEKNNLETPLHLVSLNNNHELVKLLLENGADIDPKDNQGKTPLHYASWKNSKEALILLLRNGADISVEDETSERPLYYATLNDSKNAQDLLQQTQIADRLLLTAITANNPTKVKRAIKKFENLELKDRIKSLNDKENYAHLVINGEGNSEQKITILKLLLNLEIDISKTDANGDNLISLALKKGDSKLIETLYERDSFAQSLREAVKKIESIEAPPASCFSCLSSGALTISFASEAHESEPPPPVKIGLKKQLSADLQSIFEQKSNATGNLGFGGRE